MDDEIHFLKRRIYSCFITAFILGLWDHEMCWLGKSKKIT